MGQEFLGVYATNEAAPPLGDFPRPLGKRKRLWFVWKTPEGRYKVQAINAVHQPMADARILAVGEFEQRFSLEPGCLAVPEGYVKPHDPEEECPTSPLPDLFSQGLDTPPKPRPFFHEEKQEDDGRLRADDPDLLRNWAKMEPRIKKRTLDPAKIPFDRLVGEVEQEESLEYNIAAAPPSVFHEEAETQQPEEARLLRSKFVQALLLLRRGEREESIALLQDMLHKAYPPFTGAAQLFSEFGLGLRRLGLIKLALAAHRRAWEYAPEDERVLFNIARSYHDLDLLDDAKHFLEKALAVAPDFASARQFLAFLDASSHKDA